MKWGQGERSICRNLAGRQSLVHSPQAPCRYSTVAPRLKTRKQAHRGDCGGAVKQNCPLIPWLAYPGCRHPTFPRKQGWAEQDHPVQETPLPQRSLLYPIHNPQTKMERPFRGKHTCLSRSLTLWRIWGQSRWRNWDQSRWILVSTWTSSNGWEASVF